MSINPSEWTDTQWWDVLKTAAGLILSGIVIPYARKALKEARAARTAAEQTAAQTAVEQRVDGEVKTVSAAQRIEDIAARQDQQAGALDLSAVAERVLRIENMITEKGTGTRRVPTTDLPRWSPAQLQQQVPLPPAPAPQVAPQPAPGPNLTTSVPLPEQGGN